jgi:hypothetical protein
MSPFCLPSALRPQGLATLLALAAATAALPAQAQNLLQNGSFEQGNWVNYAGSWAKLTSGSSALSGWAVTGDPIAWSSPSNSDGVVAFDENRQGGIAQSFATHAGASYRVSFMLGGIASYGAMVRLRVDVAGVQQDFTLEPSAGNTWSQRDLDFVAQGGLTTLTLSGVYNPNGYYIGLDAVSVTAAVPEPQAAVLLLAGLGGLSLLARRRRC